MIDEPFSTIRNEPIPLAFIKVFERDTGTNWSTKP